MALDGDAAQPGSVADHPGRRWVEAAPFVVGLAALAFPIVPTLANESWSQETGAHGPIVLVTGGWLVWRLWPQLRHTGRAGNPLVTGLILMISLIAYLVGGVSDLVTGEAAGIYGTGLAMAQSRFGSRTIFRNWFPFLYLAFAVPLPGWFLAAATGPLKHFVSFAATHLLIPFGVPVASQGVTIFVGPYQLLVEDACSGMNSIIGLTAISLFYIYLRHGSTWRHSLLMVALVLPIAIVTNILRICTLILITYSFGDAVGQGFLHMTAGIVLFGVALALVFAIDGALTISRNKLSATK